MELTETLFMLNLFTYCLSKAKFNKLTFTCSIAFFSGFSKKPTESTYHTYNFLQIYLLLLGHTLKKTFFRTFKLKLLMSFFGGCKRYRTYISLLLVLLEPRLERKDDFAFTWTWLYKLFQKLFKVFATLMMSSQTGSCIWVDDTDKLETTGQEMGGGSKMLTSALESLK